MRSRTRVGHESRCESEEQPALSSDSCTGMELSLLAGKKECDLIKAGHSFGLFAVKV